MGSKNLSPIDVTENNSGRFMSLSVLIHAAMIASVALMSLPPSDFSPKNLIEFEVESDVADTKPIADGQKVPETMGPVAPIKAEAPPPPPPEEKVSKAEAPVLPKAVVVAPKAAPAAPIVATAPVVAKAAPVAAPAAAPALETLDDIQAPDLETSDSGEVAVAKFDEKDLQEDFEKVDQKNQKALAAAKQSMEKETEDAEAEGQAALMEAEKVRQAEAKALAEAQEARRAKAAAAIAAAKASEEAAAQKAADDEAEEKAAAIAAAKAAADEADSAERAAKANAAKEGQGRGDSGNPEPTIAVAGIPGGVRSVDQLRKISGKAPEYSREERRAGQEGKAIFYAYVNNDGSLSQFKLGQTTGYRNLDGKTLAALKKWKFHPGQEGWVELPFKWTLAGDAKEDGGTLRNKR